VIYLHLQFEDSGERVRFCACAFHSLSFLLLVFFLGEVNAHCVDAHCVDAHCVDAQCVDVSFVIP